ncbi:MAG: YHYH protein [Deltaproteobacteria bacterium]|nr:YHYH protein [Deltaproteobacteria bacterium]
MRRVIALALCPPALLLFGCDISSTATADCWEAGTVLDVSGAAGAGANYANPDLWAGCTDDSLIIEGNGIPTYSFVQMTPNPLTEQSYSFDLPRNPEVAAQTTEMPLLGLAGVAVNGLVFFGPNEAGQPASSAWGDPIYNGITDGCFGHTAGEYHFHALSQKCLTQDAVGESEPWTLADPNPAEASPVIGWAMDGFPIYGPYGCLDSDCTEVAEMKSGFDQIADPTQDAWDAYAWSEKSDPTFLDACNGRVQPDGSYGYHATEGFPYIIGCYVGTPVDTGLGAMP